ncbi:MAG: alpha/beta hydrolase [Pirellulales bacterium]
MSADTQPRHTKPGSRQVPILYLHGYGARPGGIKPQYLAAQGFEIDNPGLPDDNFARSVEIAQAAFDARRPQVVVGSSRGGAVAMNCDLRGAPLVLVAPAWRRWGTAAKVPRETILLHSAADEVIPLADSRELAAASGLDDSSLVVVGDEHRMIDARALAALAAAIRRAAGRPR